ncbi:hypothetical protein H5410_006168, partial [Solanum commersonii]
MAKGESSTDQKADWIEDVEAKVQWLYNYWQTHFPGTKEDKMLDMELAISTCIVDIYAIIPEVPEYLEHDIPFTVPKDPQHHIEECIKYAEREIKLKDPEGCLTWLIDELGSAYLTSFILDGIWNDHAILMSLEAFEKAERIDTIKSKPDFQCECGL